MSRESLNLPYIVLTGVIVIAIMAAFLVIWPLLEKAQGKSKELATLEEGIAEKESALLAIDQQKNELLQQAENEKALQVVLPLDDALEDVSRIVYRYAQTSGVTVTVIRNDTTQAAAALVAARNRGGDTETPAQAVPVSTAITIVGTYQQTRTFIELLERSPRLGDVRKIQINRNAEQPDTVTTQLDVHFYKYQPPSNGQ